MCAQSSLECVQLFQVSISTLHTAITHVITGWNGRASCEFQWHMASETPLFQLQCAMRERDWKSLNNFTHVKCVRSEYACMECVLYQATLGCCSKLI